MTDRPASLPMYDADPAAVAAWWGGIARALHAEGVAGVPSAPAWPADLDGHWRDARLLLSQTCGYPLVTSLAGAVQVVGAFRYGASGCRGIDYRSEIVVRSSDAAHRPEELLGHRAAVNAVDSHSGSNALRGWLATLACREAVAGAWLVTGSHRQSLEAVRSGRADVAAIDCITLAGLRRHAPAAVRGLRVIGSTALAPGLPLITSASTSPADLVALRRALASVCTNGALAATREALFIDGFEAVDAEAWRAIDEMRRALGDGA